MLAVSCYNVLSHLLTVLDQPFGLAVKGCALCDLALAGGVFLAVIPHTGFRARLFALLKGTDRPEPVFFVLCVSVVAASVLLLIVREAHVSYDVIGVPASVVILHALSIVFFEDFFVISFGPRGILCELVAVLRGTLIGRVGRSVDVIELLKAL